MLPNCFTNFESVNEILGDHNVDKQITDNKGDVRIQYRHFKYYYANDHRLRILWQILAMFILVRLKTSLIAWSP